MSGDTVTEITLTKPWGGYAAGTLLAVLGPRQNPRPAAVDGARAATLIAGDYAHAGTAPAPEPKAKRKRGGEDG